MPSPGYVERREQLLKSAGVVFRDKGLEGASINDIAAAVGSDRASVYYYYESKEEIFLDLVSRAVTEVVVAAEAIEASPAGPADRLARHVETLFDSFDRHYPYLQLYLQEDLSRLTGKAAEAAEAVVDLGRRYEAALGAVMADGVNSGVFRPGLDPQMLRFAVLGAVSWSHRWFRPGGPKSGAEIGQEFAQLFLKGVAAQRPRRPTS